LWRKRPSVRRETDREFMKKILFFNPRREREKKLLFLEGRRKKKRT